MLLSNQQKFLLDALDTLGGATLAQLTKLLRPVFCSKKPEVAPRIVDAAIRQMNCCNIELCQVEDLVYFPGRQPNHRQLEAVDIMLELSGGRVLGYWCGKLPILLRFSIEEQKARQFAIITSGADLYGVELHHTERIILLFDGQGKVGSLPVPNKQFYAVRQENGTHRFFAADGQIQGGK